MIFQKQPLYPISPIQVTRKAYQAFSEASSLSKVTFRFPKQQLDGSSKRETFSDKFKPDDELTNSQFKTEQQLVP